MALSLTSFKTMGVVYKVPDTTHTKKGYPKREIWIEIPTTTMSQKQKTIIVPFLVLGDECGSLDFYTEGEFLEVLFALDSFMWTDPTTGNVKPLLSLKIIDLHRRENPFETKEDIDDSPDALSPDIVAELATNVKDYSREVDKELPFDNNEDDLPF